MCVCVFLGGGWVRGGLGLVSLFVHVCQYNYRFRITIGGKLSLSNSAMWCCGLYIIQLNSLGALFDLIWLIYINVLFNFSFISNVKLKVFKVAFSK